MTIVEAARTVTGGIDTHGETHVAAVLDEVGGLLGTESFEANPDGYSALLSWLAGFGAVGKVGVEGTGAYGADWPDSSLEPASRSSRSTGPTARTAVAPASPTRSTRSRPPELPCRAEPAVMRSLGTVPSRPSGSSWWPNGRHARPG